MAINKVNPSQVSPNQLQTKASAIALKKKQLEAGSMNQPFDPGKAQQSDATRRNVNSDQVRLSRDVRQAAANAAKPDGDSLGGRRLQNEEAQQVALTARREQTVMSSDAAQKQTVSEQTKERNQEQADKQITNRQIVEGYQNATLHNRINNGSRIDEKI